MKITLDAPTIALSERVVGASSVIFIGYSARDTYLLELLARYADNNHVFGDGPHFAVLAEANNALPTSVRTIKYVPQPHKDHRTAIDIVEEIGAVAVDRVANGVRERSTGTPTILKSAHVMYEVYPPG